MFLNIDENNNVFYSEKKGIRYRGIILMAVLHFALTLTYNVRCRWQLLDMSRRQTVSYCNYVVLL